MISLINVQWHRCQNSHCCQVRSRIWLRISMWNEGGSKVNIHADLEGEAGLWRYSRALKCDDRCSGYPLFAWMESNEWAMFFMTATSVRNQLKREGKRWCFCLFINHDMSNFHEISKVRFFCILSLTCQFQSITIILHHTIPYFRGPTTHKAVQYKVNLDGNAMISRVSEIHEVTLYGMLYWHRRLYPSYDKHRFYSRRQDWQQIKLWTVRSNHDILNYST